MFPIRIYPDRLSLRLAYALADLIALGWLFVWASVARFVYETVMALSVIAQGVTDAGNSINAFVTALQQSAQQNVPLVGGWLAGVVQQVNGSGTPLVALGQSGAVAIHSLAVALAVTVGGPPLLAGVLTYLPWRWRHTREFAALHVMMRRAGPAREDDALRILAARALYSLPYHVLLAYSRNPIEEFAGGHYENLARAAMGVQGLDVERYLALPAREASVAAERASKRGQAP